jgi:hypothetical protein
LINENIEFRLKTQTLINIKTLETNNITRATTANEPEVAPFQGTMLPDREPTLICEQ